MIYVVQQGDTLYSISQQTQIPVWKIEHDNQLSGQTNLVEGQALLLLGIDESGSIRDDLYVTGYAYPFIEQYILEQSFPAINELLIFSYGFTFTGELVPPNPDESWMIALAWQNEINPMLVLTPFAEGTFNNQLVKVLVENVEIQQTLIENLLATMKEKGYAGVDIDFEYILPENRVGYAEFVGRVRETMNANDYKVSVALAPKTSSDQPGLLYEGMDYELLGANADHVFLMTYEWGFTYGPPMAVAPLNMVQKVVEYAQTKIPAEKIIMGIPNYGYDWPLPFERGVTKARLIGNVEAPQIAEENGVEIQYSDVSQSPFFTYTREGIAHEVWFEDVRSITAKINLAKEHNLFGVGYWNLMRPFRANWMLLDKTGTS
ncbi:MAG: glycosyl hydrolase family 18 protein [Muricomes sp.]